MLIGTNDLAYDGPPRSPELAAEGIRANLLYLRERLPDDADPAAGAAAARRFAEFRAAAQGGRSQRLISGCADRRSVFYAEYRRRLLDAQGRLTAEISPDRLHFSEIGYARLMPRLDAMIDLSLAALSARTMDPRTMDPRTIDHGAPAAFGEEPHWGELCRVLSQAITIWSARR